MDGETYSNDEYMSAPGADDPVFTSSGGGMFASSQHFVVAGGTFNNSTNNYVTPPAAPPDFRMISMGDIDLQKELMINKESSAIGRRRERNCVRRVYSAKVDGRKLNLTVGVYQGHGAEEDWQRDTEMYTSVRHPNIIQIWAGASDGSIHATVFHGDLVPLEVFLACQSPIMRVYLCAYCWTEWLWVKGYFYSLRRDLHYWECTMWIRCSTGRLSVDPVPPDPHTEFFWYSKDLFPILLSSLETSLRQAAHLSGPPNTEVLAIESLALKQYHRICYLYLKQYRDGSISTSATVHIGAISFWPSQHQSEEHVEIALLPEIEVFRDNGWRIAGRRAGDFAENGWRCCKADGVSDTKITLRVDSYDAEAWLSQANSVFSRLQITSNLEDYFLMESIYFTITVQSAGEDPPRGYLFLCPKEDFETSPSSYRWPNRPVYWSLDPEGIEVLSTEEAAYLGFPSFQLTTEVRGKCWDPSVYTGLRTFHQAKGFNPDSQEVALHLGKRLFRLSRDVNSPFAQAAEISAEGQADEVRRDGGPDGGRSLDQYAPTDDTGVPVLKESPPVSRGFHFTMMVQLMLIFLLSLFSLYEQVF